MVVKFRVEADGAITNPTIVEDELGDQALGTCVVKLVQHRSLSAPPTGCVDVAMPLRFQPKSLSDGGVDSGP
jgi:hypothetical protein